MIVSTPTVLIVDDLPQNAIALGALLAPLAVRVLSVNSGTEALEALLVEDVALALIDVNMPGMSGFDLAEAMRGVERTRRVPIIFVTAASGDPLRRFKGYERGAVDFLQKPLDPVVIRSKVEVFIELARSRAELQARLAELDHHRRHLEDMVADRVGELSRARQTAEDASRAKSDFLASMSHEIRTPMNGVLGMLEVLEQTPLSDKQQDFLRTARSSGETLLGIIDDILDISKIEAGRLELEPAPVAIEELVESLCESLAPLAARRGVDLSPFVDPALPAAMVGDALRLRQVLLNLVGNAIKFSAARDGRRGRVALRATLADGGGARELALSVVDNGIGISAEAIARLFRPFAQAEASTARRYGGSGLGLAICQRLVALMGGRIEADSTPGQGSTFRVTLPLQPVSQGPQAEQALQGVTCIGLLSPAFDADALTAYLAHAGAQIHWASDAASLAGLLRRLPAPRVLLYAAGEGAASPSPSPVSGLGADTGVVALARGDAPMPSDREVLLDATVLRRASLLEAVATAAGRSRPCAPRAADQSASRAPPPLPVDEARARGELILVAEDDDINRQVIQRQLELLGRTAVIVTDGIDAVARLADGGFGLLLTDLHMPQLDGYALAQAIRRGERAAGSARLPVIALTASALHDDESRAQAAGIDACLTKPLQLGELRAAIDRWLPPRVQMAPSTAVPSAAAPTPLVLDTSVLRRLIGNDDDAVREFLGFYVKSEKPLFDELEQARAQGDLAAAGSIAHRLRSSSITIGAATLGGCCAELERICRNGERAALDQAVLQSRQELQRVLAAIDLVLRSGAAAAQPRLAVDTPVAAAVASVMPVPPSETSA